VKQTVEAEQTELFTFTIQ